ncbi:replication-relaxation family protein [Streptomyces sp. CL12-4]|nr:replication-relaxation family protein [Streptomyces sp. CL12-4]
MTDVDTSSQDRLNVDTGSRDRLTVAVLAQYRMATTEQTHLILSTDVRIEQTRRRLMKLRGEGLIDRSALPQAGRTRVWHAAQYGAQVAAGWPELRGRRPSRGAHDRTAVRLGVGHGLTVTKGGTGVLNGYRPGAGGTSVERQVVVQALMTAVVHGEGDVSDGYARLRGPNRSC